MSRIEVQWRNRLETVREWPARYAIELERARENLKVTVPLLIRMAVSPEPIQATAERLLRDIFRQCKEVSTILLIHSNLPSGSSALAELAADVTRWLLENYHGGPGAEDGTEAMLWNNLSERCHDRAQPEFALRSAERAVELSRSLNVRIRAQRRIRVICHLTLAKRKAERGCVDEALVLALETWRSAERLRFSPRLDDRRLGGRAAVNLANRLVAGGRRYEAREFALLAIKTLRTTGRSKESRFDLALAHLAAANIDTDLGCHHESLPHADRADRLFRGLSGYAPDRYFEFAASAANTFALNLTRAGRLQTAHDILLHNLEKMQWLQCRWPLRFGREYAAYLISLSDSAGNLGQYEDALRFAGESVAEIRRFGRLAKKRDWQHEGMAGTNLSNLLQSVGRFEEASVVISTSHRAFLRVRGDRYAALLGAARALRSLAESWRIIGRSGASRTARRALKTLQRVKRPWSEAVQELNAVCLSTLGICLAAEGRVQRALKAELSSLRIRRRLSDGSPSGYRAGLAYSLHQLAKRLFELGQFRAALRRATESVGHYNTMFPGAPDHVFALGAEALQTRGEMALAAGRTDLGIQSLVEAIRLLRPRYLACLEVWSGRLAPIAAKYFLECHHRGIPIDAPLVEDVLAAEARRGDGAQSELPLSEIGDGVVLQKVCNRRVE